MYKRIINYLIKKDKLINKLILDRYFGIYNRNGFEYILSKLDEQIICIILVDFNNVKGMNKELGYNKVNEIFTNVFNELKSIFIIGRAFSGDEIFFYAEDRRFGIDEVISTSRKHGLELKSVFKMCNTKNITGELDSMIDKLHYNTINE